MKKGISITILIMLVILGSQSIITKLNKSHIYKYSIYKNDSKYDIIESYSKKDGDSYTIEVNDGTNSFYYTFGNTFNKQKKVITDVEIFTNNNDVCIYPVLRNNIDSYLECNSNGNLYTHYTYADQAFINSVYTQLKEKYPYLVKEEKETITEAYGTSLMYKSNLKETDSVILWQYKGIWKFGMKTIANFLPLEFDKYENKLGTMVDKYYIMPNYTNSNVLEFSSVYVIDLASEKKSKIELGYTLSSNTYVNGVVDNKLYYTDPSNLFQLEFNPKDNTSKIIGNTELGGKLYKNGDWESVNIYDFASSEIKFNNLPQIDLNYKELKEGGSSYYYYTSDGSIYQLVKEHLDKPILIYKVNGLNNFNAVEEDIFYVAGDTVYRFNVMDGNLPIFKENELIYNTYNRISIYRNK